MRVGHTGPNAMRRRAARLGFALACATLLACPHAPPPESLRPKNLILVVVDTLRADHLALYGYERPTSPQLEALAKSGVVVDNARSQSACTFSSVASLLTGKYPSRIIAVRDGTFGIPSGHASLAEVLKKEGYATWAVSASQIVRVTGTQVNENGGFGPGFDVFDESCEEMPASCVTDRAIELTSDAKQPFFLYLHYLDPHEPYRPPQSFTRSFSNPKLEGNLSPFTGRLYKQGTNPPMDDGELSDMIAAYDDEILYWDDQFARLFEHLRSMGRLEDTVVVLTSDHGEAFLEHDDLGHCRNVFDTSTHIPMVFWLPTDDGDRRIDAPIENVDVLATALDVMGVPVPDDLDGQSVRSILEGERVEPDLAFSAQVQHRSVTDGRFKLIFDLDSSETSFYDLQADPGEQTYAVDAFPKDYIRLEKALREHLSKTELTRTRHQQRRMQKKLRALGYLQ